MRSKQTKRKKKKNWTQNEYKDRRLTLYQRKSYFSDYSESLWSSAVMMLLLLCLGLTLVCAYEEGNHDVVTSNIDISKVDFWKIVTLNYAGWFGGFSGKLVLLKVGVILVY